MVQFPQQGIFVIVPYGVETSVCLMNRNVMADISWNGSSVDERRSHTFKDGSNPGLFQLQTRGDSPPPKKRSQARSCRCISRGRILDQQPKSYDRPQKKEGDRRRAAMLLKVQEDKRMLEHRAAELEKCHLRETDQCSN